MSKKLFIVFAIVELIGLGVGAACNIIGTIQAKTHARIAGYEAGRAIVIEGEKIKEEKKKAKLAKQN